MYSTSPLLSLLPPVVSAVALGLWWATGELHGWRAVALVAWFLGALAVQEFGGSVTTWAVGLVLQTLLAVFLVLRAQVGT